jgi:hypothetical protein
MMRPWLMANSSFGRKTEGDSQMRKLILVAAIAMMSTTSCYANLSLASNEPAPTTAEQPNAAPSEAIKGSAPARSSTIARSRKRHLPGVAAYPAYPVHSFSYGRCL